VTKARAYKGAGQEEAWESHFMFLGAQESVRECTFTLPSELPLWEFRISMDSQWTPNGFPNLHRAIARVKTH